MTDDRLPDPSTLIKQVGNLPEALYIPLIRIEAMLELLLVTDLSAYPNAKLHEYLCIISDIVEHAKEVFNEPLKAA